MKKLAFITGGSKGIGFAIAKNLMAQGIDVAITARNMKDLERAKEELENDSNALCYAYNCDVTDYEKMQEVVSNILAQCGRMDYVIANAGVGHFANIEDMSMDQWKQTIDVNLTGVFNTIKTTVDALKNTKGYFITIASLAGTNFFAKGAAYNASKFGLVGFTQAVMLDLRKYGVKVSTIMPGSVSTYFNNHIPSHEDSWKIQAEDIAQIVSDLIKMPARTLPSKIEVRPSIPPNSK